MKTSFKHLQRYRQIAAWVFDEAHCLSWATQALEAHYRDFKTLHGQRPTALESCEEGYNPRAVRPKWASWVRFVDSQGDLSPEQRRVLDSQGRSSSRST